VTVRAINGNGVVSEETSYGPVVIDDETPTPPGMLADGISMPSVTKPGSNTYNQATYDEIYVSARENADQVDPSTPQITLSWAPATDNHSGIHRYRVAVSTSSSSEVAFNEGEIYYVNATQNPELTVSGGDLNFEDEFYFHIMAEDRAGNQSDIITLDPVQIQDPTAPTAPEIIARANNGTLGFYLTKPAADPDTGIEEYHYIFVNHQTGALITNASGTISSSGGVTSSTAARTQSQQSIGGIGGAFTQNTTLSFRQLPTDNVPKGVPLRLRVVAVNGQGEVSRFAQSGVFFHDTTPPVEPSISVTQNDGKLDISVSSIYDPESGVRSAEYRVVNSSGSVVKSWAPLLTLSSVNHSSQSASKSWNYGSHDPGNLVVEVRIRNGNGMERVDTATPFIPIMTITQTQTFQWTY
jgi:hypothetical protein